MALPEGDRDAVGDWVERPASLNAGGHAQHKMALRHARDKSLSAGAVKQRILVVLADVAKSCKTEDLSWNDVRDNPVSMERVYHLRRTLAWSALPADGAASAPARSTESSEESSRSSSSSQSCEPVSILWFTQGPKSAKHICQTTSASHLAPYCRHFSFDSRHYERGSGGSAGDVWCRKCLARAPATVQEALQEL